MSHYLYKVGIKQWPILIVVELLFIELVLAIQHWQHHALYIYRFLHISVVVEMHEITQCIGSFLYGEENGDRGEDLFMYCTEILI